MNPAPGVLLVATPALTDPSFRRTVVYLVEHSAEGALGFIVNRPMDIALGDLWGDCPPGLTACSAAAEGGPVERHKGLLLHGHCAIEGTAPMGQGRFVGGDLRHIADHWQSGTNHHGPRLYLGHSGWVGGQLEEEIANGAWLLRPGTIDLIVSGVPDGLSGEQLWEQLSSGPHGLPKPSLN